MMNVEDVVALYMANIIDRAEARNLIGLEEAEKPKKPSIEPEPGEVYVFQGKPLTEQPKRFTRSEVENMTTKEFTRNRAAILKRIADDGKTLTITKDSSMFETLTAVLAKLDS
ncbi:hypothetical protein [Streptomyces sp. B1I3]|uniref:hypothetical protein n=1 Tax=Streptomyces sp. B1I3 TaxID=3042264 RepID=UPI0027803455|nr:hypothetical protein [Streptomyces sp. B1I3]MDQ0793572.1 hypothetical protein [Streptomyces sp. B1I3]